MYRKVRTGKVWFEDEQHLTLLKLIHFDILVMFIESGVGSFAPSRGGTAMELLGHVLERLGEVLLAEGQLADGPDLGVLRYNTLDTCWEYGLRRRGGVAPGGREHTGLRFFFSSESRVPALRAMISGAASGSWAMGEPHSEQKRRWTMLPEEPLVPEYFLTGPLMVSLSLGTTATRAEMY